MELSAGRQTLNMKAFNSTMAVVYVSSLTWLICLLELSFFWCSCFMLWSHIPLAIHWTTLIWLISMMQRFLWNYYADINMACFLLRMSLHSFTASCRHTHTYIPLPFLFSIKTSRLTQDGRGGQAEPRGQNWGCIWGVRYWEGHLHFSLCVFTDSDTISCSVWWAFDCEPGTEM